MIKENKQNILSLDKNNLEPNQNIFTQNLLNQNNLELDSVYKQEIITNIQELISQKNFSYEKDLTVKKGLKIKVEKFTQSMNLKSATCQIINQKEKQNAIIFVSTNKCNSSDISQQKFIQKDNSDPIKFEHQGLLGDTILSDSTYSIDDCLEKEKQSKNEQNDSYCLIKSFTLEETISQGILKTDNKIIAEQKSYMQDKTNGSSYQMNDKYENLIDQLSQLELKEYISLKNELLEYNFHDYEKSKQDAEEQIKDMIEREWKQEIFDAINKNVFKNNNFEKYKSDIFAKLENKKIYICKLLSSSEKGDLFLGYEKPDKSYDDTIIKIRYQPTKKELQYDISVMKALGSRKDIYKGANDF
ncbi:hypothetical protein ABPG72_006922 [Tetrahymena utriculariae]